MVTKRQNYGRSDNVGRLVHKSAPVDDKISFSIKDAQLINVQSASLLTKMPLMYDEVVDSTRVRQAAVQECLLFLPNCLKKNG